MANKKPVPNESKAKTAELKASSVQNAELNESPVKDELPDVTAVKEELPKDYDETKAVNLDGDIRVIKSTKLKYQRNRTAMAYRILLSVPLPDVLAMDKGIVDPDRDGDQILFDFLVAVFDDVEYVKKHYDDMTAADVDRIVKIYCEVNNINEKEELAKNRAAKGTKA